MAAALADGDELAIALAEIARLGADLDAARTAQSTLQTELDRVGRTLRFERRRYEEVANLNMDLGAERDRLRIEIEELRRLIAARTSPLPPPLPQQLPRAQRRQMEREQRRRP